ncbi:hypothetical protein RF11_10559 [Thelohanellus kitauei]|uniref:Uncharacterized protein n=1 Tax=Thelohanellus kitauei TaxID=669202 RepID=A0A0C2IHE5_THEKT|nr:hypothetical protein RF11_10559 [Thelohanellus kitauei]
MWNNTAYKGTNEFPASKRNLGKAALEGRGNGGECFTSERQAQSESDKQKDAYQECHIVRDKLPMTDVKKGTKTMSSVTIYKKDEVIIHVKFKSCRSRTNDPSALDQAWV